MPGVALIAGAIRSKIYLRVRIRRFFFTMATSILSVKGQTTIPKEVRDHLKAGPNDRLAYIPLEDGSVRITAVRNSVAAVRGMLSDLAKRKKRVTIEEMDRAMVRELARRHKR